MASPATTTAVQSAAAIASSNLSASSVSPSSFISDEGNPKATYSSKLGNSKGRVSENVAATNSASSRQSSAPKVWVSGTNPLTQRAPNSNQRNGISSQAQSSPMGSSSATLLLREGMKVRVTLDSGAEIEGTYASGAESSYTLKMAQQKKLPNSGDVPNGNAKTGREQATMSVQKKDVADIHVMGTALPNRSVRSQNGTSTAFRTDADISGSRFQGERVLQAWVADNNIQTDMSLESGAVKSSTGGVWNQFEANERLFGLTTDYDENLYTTTIDTNGPDFHKRYAAAAKTAREIEGSSASNSHVAEERVVDNLAVDDTGTTEEDRYSGVQKQDSSLDYPPLASSSRANKYTPPARRPTVEQPPSSVPSLGLLTDPAIISSSLVRKDSPAADKGRGSQAQITEKAQTTLPEPRSSPKPKESNAVVTPEAKSTAPDASGAVNRTVSPHSRPAGVPNATATVERDVVNAFRGFASQQRIQADKIRSNKAKQDKEIKLHELKKFAASFKLNSPVPSDLVSIIAKDPVKQREIQEKAKRDAEEQAEKGKLTKASSAETTSSAMPNVDPKAAQRSSATAAPHAGIATNGPSGRSNQGRPSGYAPQGPYNPQSFKTDRSGQNQSIPIQNGRPIHGLGARLRNIEQNNKSAQVTPQIPQHETRQPPTGPANNGDPNFSRRSSGAISMMPAKLNPNSNEFRPSPFAVTFNPNGNPSSGSSPRSSSTGAPSQPIIVSAATLIRRRPLQVAGKISDDVATMTYINIIECVAAAQPPAGVGKKWESNGSFKPAYDTILTWRQVDDKEPADSTMNQTYAKQFENPPYVKQTMSPPQPSHVHPQAPHQHQLPFHLQQGSHNMSQRQSPRQPQIHLHNNQHNHGPDSMFNPSDGHRMMPSHSAQSFASPRLQNANMAYASPMSQPAQLAYNQQMMQFPMGPVAPQQYRSYSGGHQFVPQQVPHMNGPVMMPAPAGNGFMGPTAMVHPNPQMMYPAGQPQFIPQGNGPPPMPGSNGYPSPGRAAPMMMQQGSQPGQSVYGLSPGLQYGQPIYAQQQPPQMPNMRGYGSQTQQFGTSPQMHQYGPPHRGAPSGNYNKNYMPQHGPHPPSQQTQVLTGPQARPVDGGDDVK